MEYPALQPAISNPIQALNRPLQDLNYFLEHREQLIAEYSGQYVAIRRCEIVGAALTRRELQSVLLERYGDNVYAFVRKVCESAFESPLDETLAV